MDEEITDPAVLQFLYGWPTGEDFMDAVEGNVPQDGIRLTPRKPVWLAKSSAVTIPLVPPNPPRNKIKVKVQRRDSGPGPGPTIKEISAEEAAEFEARKKSVHFAPTASAPVSGHKSKRRRVDAGGILRPVSAPAPALTHQNSGPNVFTMSDIQ
jgi:hypothetical protein